MLRSMLADIRIALVAVLINRVLHCVASGPDALANGGMGVFGDSVPFVRSSLDRFAPERAITGKNWRRWHLLLVGLLLYLSGVPLGLGRHPVLAVS
jgi:hypothetical protein